MSEIKNLEYFERQEEGVVKHNLNKIKEVSRVRKGPVSDIKNNKCLYPFEVERKMYEGILLKNSNKKDVFYAMLQDDDNILARFFQIDEGKRALQYIKRYSEYSEQEVRKGKKEIEVFFHSFYSQLSHFYAQVSSDIQLDVDSDDVRLFTRKKFLQFRLDREGGEQSLFLDGERDAQKKIGRYVSEGAFLSAYEHLVLINGPFIWWSSIQKSEEVLLLKKLKKNWVFLETLSYNIRKVSDVTRLYQTFLDFIKSIPLLSFSQNFVFYAKLFIVLVSSQQRGASLEVREALVIRKKEVEKLLHEFLHVSDEGGVSKVFVRYVEYQKNMEGVIFSKKKLFDSYFLLSSEQRRGRKEWCKKNSQAVFFLFEALEEEYLRKKQSYFLYQAQQKALEKLYGLIKQGDVKSVMQCVGDERDPVVFYELYARGLSFAKGQAFHLLWSDKGVRNISNLFYLLPFLKYSDVLNVFDVFLEKGER